MKLVQSSISYTDSLEEFLEERRADILLLQGVKKSITLADCSDHLQGIKKKSNLKYSFYSPLCDKKFARDILYNGNAIISRDPLVYIYQEFTYKQYKKNYDYEKEGRYPCLFQHAVMQMPCGYEINLINYRGPYSGERGAQTLGDLATTKYCRRIAEYAANLKGPKIVAGNFNLAPESESLSPINTILRNLRVEDMGGKMRDPRGGNRIPVDYIWVSQDIVQPRFEIFSDNAGHNSTLCLEFDI